MCVYITPDCIRDTLGHKAILHLTSEQYCVWFFFSVYAFYRICRLANGLFYFFITACDVQITGHCHVVNPLQNTFFIRYKGTFCCIILDFCTWQDIDNLRNAISIKRYSKTESRSPLFVCIIHFISCNFIWSN